MLTTDRKSFLKSKKGNYKILAVIQLNKVGYDFLFPHLLSFFYRKTFYKTEIKQSIARKNNLNKTNKK